MRSTVSQLQYNVIDMEESDPKGSEILDGTAELFTAVTPYRTCSHLHPLFTHPPISWLLRKVLQARYITTIIQYNTVQGLFLGVTLYKPVHSYAMLVTLCEKTVRPKDWHRPNRKRLNMISRGNEKLNQKTKNVNMWRLWVPKTDLIHKKD